VEIWAERLDPPTLPSFDNTSLAPDRLHIAFGVRASPPARIPSPDCTIDPNYQPTQGDSALTQIDTTSLELSGFEGTLLRPGDRGYDQARTVFNAMIDRSPALLARCGTARDVAAAVDLASQHNMALSVYGGGHGVTGSAVCDDGICIDLRPMKAVSVDPDTATVRAEAGLTWGELDAATQAHGLAVTGGRVSTTGIGGLALGSGSGWLERKLGFTCDNLIRVEIVTADGRQLEASATENPDLFWALRGGGGNFGIVTAFHFKLHQVGPVVLGGMLIYPSHIARRVVQFWRDFMLDAPDEVGTALAFITAPDLDILPDTARQKPAIGIVVCYSGDLEQGTNVLQPLLDFGPPAANLVQPMPYLAVQQILDPANPKGMLNYWTADFLSDLSDNAVDTLAELATQPVSPLTQIIIIPGGGALSRVADDATAFGNRQAPWNIHYLSMWPDPAHTDRNIAYTRQLSIAMKPWSTGGAYLNFLGDEGRERIAAAFGPDKYQRLQSIKTKYDPTNLFRHNQNIQPSAQ
jgi:FAD/FMN-containing dehydrogenase